MQITSARLIRMLGHVLLLLLGETAAANGVTQNCHNELAAFLSAPDKDSLSALVRTGQVACWKILESSNENLGRLIKNVAGGNQWASRFLVNHLEKLDGGNLEDSLIALGQFADHDMTYFLALARVGSISQWAFTNSLTMLPHSTDDNPQRQLDILQTRRQLLMGIDRQDLIAQRGTALRAIDEFEAEIRLHGVDQH